MRRSLGGVTLAGLFALIPMTLHAGPVADRAMARLKAPGVSISSWTLMGEAEGGSWHGHTALSGVGTLEMSSLSTMEELSTPADAAEGAPGALKAISFQATDLIWTSPGGGRITAQMLLGEDLSALSFALMGQGGCASFAPVELRAEGVRFIADEDLLPHSSTPEELTADRANLLIGPDQEGCPQITVMEASGIGQSTDGYRFSADTLLLRRDTRFVTRLERALLSGPDMEMIAKAEAIELRFGIEAEIDKDNLSASLRALWADLARGAPPEGRALIRLEGFDMPLSLGQNPRYHIPGISDLQLPEDYRLKGDLLIEAEVDEGGVRLLFDQDIEGLLLAKAELQLLASPLEAEGGLSAAIGQRAGILGAYRLKGASFGLHNKGLWQIMAANGVPGPVDLLRARRDGLLARVPGVAAGNAEAMFDAVLLWADPAEKEYVSAKFEPLRPVSALEFGAMLAASPRVATRMLNVTVE